MDKSKSTAALSALTEALRRKEEFNSQFSFDINGELVDGAQRNQAVIESGESICVNIETGIDPTKFFRKPTCR